MVECLPNASKKGSLWEVQFVKKIKYEQQLICTVNFILYTYSVTSVLVQQQKQ